MGRYLKQYDRDYMKMAMLKQEEIFRQQVHDLHRLYRVQKLLMNDMKAELKRQKKSSNMHGWNAENETYSHQNHRRTSQVLDLELPAENYLGKSDAAMQEAEEESELELTLAIGSNNRRRKTDNSFTSDSAASFSSSSTESGGVKLNNGDWRLFHVPDMNLDAYGNEKKSAFNGEEHVRNEMVNRPPWLLQCLSLNMT